MENDNKNESNSSDNQFLEEELNKDSGGGQEETPIAESEL